MGLDKGEGSGSIRAPWELAALPRVLSVLITCPSPKLCPTRLMTIHRSRVGLGTLRDWRQQAGVGQWLTGPPRNGTRWRTASSLTKGGRRAERGGVGGPGRVARNQAARRT